MMKQIVILCRRRTVVADGLRLTNISLQIFNEVYEEGLKELYLEGEHQFKFCTLPDIVLLKRIVWDDRPEKRVDDIKVIRNIFNYFKSCITMKYGKTITIYLGMKTQI
ncbi:MAG: hypothetical protein ABIN01_22620 [Ferruginibacter sp.]